MPSRLLVLACICATPFLVTPSVATETAFPLPDQNLVSRAHDFVTVNHIHGVNYGDAKDPGGAAIPALEQYLQMEKMKRHWPNIVTTIAYIGGPESYAILDHFIHGRFSGEVDLQTYQALIVAQSVLGHVGNPAIEAELLAGTDPAHWAILPWTYQHYNGALLQLAWSKLTINALAYTATPAAEAKLLTLSSNPHHSRQMSNITEGLARIPEVREAGLDSYERGRDQLRAQAW